MPDIETKKRSHQSDRLDSALAYVNAYEMNYLNLLYIILCFESITKGSLLP